MFLTPDHTFDGFSLMRQTGELGPAMALGHVDACRDRGETSVP